MTREELDRLHEIATSGPNGIANLLDHIDRLEREAKAGRELRNFFGRYYDKNNDPQTLALKSYDTATKETASEVP